MAISELTVTVELKKRSLWGRIVRSPRLWVRHYRELRRGNGMAVSALAAWYLASRVLTFK